MAHTKADFTLPDAIAGAKLVYSKLTGDTVPNDALFYASLDVLGYGGTFIPAGSAPAKAGKKLTQAQAKKKLQTLLAPLAESEGSADAAAGAFDWKTIAALLLQILPFILPLLGK